MKFSLAFTFLCLSLFVKGQERYTIYEGKLQEMANSQPGLDQKVDLSVNDMSIQDLIRGIANTNAVNISVDNSLNYRVITNFSGVTVSEVLIFLARKYDLDLTFTGSIITVSAHYIPPPAPIEIVAKKIQVQYDTLTKTLNYELNNDTLSQVAMAITRQSNVNFVIAPELSNKLVSGFVQQLPLKLALEKLAISNSFSISETDTNIFQIDKKEVDASTKDPRRSNDKKLSPVSPGLDLNYNDDSTLVSVTANGVTIAEVLSRVSADMHKSFFLFSELKGNANLHVNDFSFDNLLRYLLNGTEYTFKRDSIIYLIGDRNLEGLRRTELYLFRFRTVDKILDIIPAELKKGIDIKAFPDLNGFILSGSQPRIEELKSYLRDIDQVIPVIQIEVLIVDVQNTKTLSTGIKAGLGDKPISTGGTVFPNVDVSLGSNSVNNLIDGLNGFGFLNLGKVTPNFYVTLRALDQQGVLKLRSTPKLATLNGHEAKLSIGRTEYYLEIQSSVVGVQNPFPVQSQNYKSVNADLSLTINPIVSGDEQITLEIAVKQSNFTERISQTAPPGTITRDFQSLIRVRNEEMIVLGGLDENSTNDSGEGFPLLSRVPVLKWLFSSRTRAAKKSKLTIFIKPTVIY